MAELESNSKLYPKPVSGPLHISSPVLPSQRETRVYGERESRPLRQGIAAESWLGQVIQETQQIRQIKWEQEQQKAHLTYQRSLLPRPRTKWQLAGA